MLPPTDPELAALEASFARPDQTMPEYLQSLIALAWRLRRTDARRALDLGREAVALSETLGRADVTSRALLVCGQAFVALNNGADAEKDLLAGLALAQEQADLRVQAECFHCLGTVRLRRNRFEEAFVYYEQGLRLRQQTGDREGEGASLSSLGVLELCRGDDPAALGFYLRSLELRREIGDQVGETNSLLNLGWLHFRMGRFAQAWECDRQGLELARRAGDRGAEAMLLGNIGLLWQQRGDPVAALDHYRQALDLDRETGARLGEVMTLGSIGEIYTETGDHAAARKFLLRAIQLSEEIDNTQQRIACLRRIALATAGLGEDAAALAYLAEVNRIAHAAGLHQKQPETELCLGQVHARLGRPEIAETHLREAARLAAEKGSLAVRLKSLLALGDLPSISVSDAELFLSEALDLIRQQGADGQSPAIHLSLSNLHKRAGRPAEALAEMESYLADKARLDRENSAWRIGALLSDFNTEQTQREIDQERRRNAELTELQRRLTESLEYARTIQETILPEPHDLARAFGPHFLLYRPKDIVSGDFYWLHQDEETGSCLFAVGDCTGHGVPGALMSMIAASLLSEIVFEKRIFSPAAVLSTLHLRLVRALRRRAAASGGLPDSVEIGLVHFDPAARRLLFAGARRPLLLADASGQLSEIRGERQPVGGRVSSGSPPSFREHEIPLPPPGQPPPALYLLTDGYADQCDPARRAFGRLRLRNLLASHLHWSLPEQGALLERELRHWQSTEAQRDDITAVGFRPGHALSPKD